MAKKRCILFPSSSSGLILESNVKRLYPNLQRCINAEGNVAYHCVILITALPHFFKAFLFIVIS
jgi:hypothetical protein